MKIAVLGASGMLGSMLVDYLSKSFQVVATVRNLDYKKQVDDVEWRLFDAASIDSLYPIVHDCSWIINAIGLIPQKSQDKDYLSKINTIFMFRLVAVAETLDIPVLQIATDCVYSGKAGRYSEASKPDPTNQYGVSKKTGEIPSTYIHYLRCSIVGKEPYGNYSLLNWLLSQPKDAEVPGYTNYLWNGVSTLHFAKVCEGIIRNNIDLPLTQHLIPFDAMSKYELLRHFAEQFGRKDIKILPKDTGEVVDRTLMTLNPVLNNKLWSYAGYNHPPSIEQMIKEMAEYLKVPAVTR